MGDILQSYTAINSSTPRTQVSSILQSIINAPAFSFNETSRAQLIRLLLKDLKSTGPKSKLTNKDAAQAILAIKTLGRIPNGAQPLSEAGSLSTLLSLSTSLKDDPDASTEALRCIANTLLLFEPARSTFLSKEVDGGEICVTMLDKATAPDQIFTLARIFFLVTVSRSPFIQTLVEEKRQGRTIIDIISNKLDATMISILAGAKFSRDAMTDLLKFAYNILMHYPKMIDSESSSGGSSEEWNDSWSPKLDGLLPPLLRAYHTIPPTSPSPLVAPLTHIIHALITIPVTPSSRPIWFNTATSAMGRSSTSSSGRKSSTNNSPANDSPVIGSPTLTPSEVPDPKRATTPPKPSTLERALSVISAGRRSLSRSPSPSPPTASHDVVLRTHDLLEVSFSHHFPDNSDPDSVEVREAFKKEITAAGIPSDTTLDDVLAPLVVLCTRLCLADEGTRVRIREWIVPADLDRTNPLDERSDFMGRCIRLLGSVYHTRLKDSVGEMLYAMCDSDAALLSSLFGYGHVAGLLFNKGVMSAPPPPSASSDSAAASSSSSSNSDQREINPITGTYAPSSSTASATADMTEEEKEQEMEKLFVLFDRLEKSGAMPASQNPMRKVIEKSMAS